MNKHSLSATAILISCFALANCGPPNIPFRSPELRSVDGTVIGVDQRTPEEQLRSGLRVKLQPQGSPLVVVELAPGWYLDRQGLHFSERDRLSIQGSSSAGDPVLHAQTVSKGSLTVRLRDEQGRPVWDSSSTPAQ